MNPMYIKKIRKILYIVCAVLVLIAAAFSVFRFVQEKKDEKLTEEKNLQNRFSYSSYRFNEAGKIDPAKVNLEDYVSLKQFGQFYIFDNSEFLEQALESTYVSVIDNGYYINNKCFSCDLGENWHCLFFGNDENYLPFYLKISSDWSRTEWYVRKDFSIPKANLNRVSEIIVVSNTEAKTLPSNSVENSDLYRINTESTIKATDRKIINQCVACYKKNSFVYDESFDFVTEAKENSQSGFILAGFENSNVYQCIGVY